MLRRSGVRSHFDASVCDLPRIKFLWPNFASVIVLPLEAGVGPVTIAIICDDISDDKHAILPPVVARRHPSRLPLISTIPHDSLDAVPSY